MRRFPTRYCLLSERTIRRPIRSRKHRERLGRKKSLGYSVRPNILGTLPGNQLGTLGSSYIPGWQGAIKVKQITEDQAVKTFEAAGYKVAWDADFDASKSNAIYGHDSTVRPEAFRILALVRAY